MDQKTFLLKKIKLEFKKDTQTYFRLFYGFGAIIFCSI